MPRSVRSPCLALDEAAMRNLEQANELCQRGQQLTPPQEARERPVQRPRRLRSTSLSDVPGEPSTDSAVGAPPSVAGRLGIAALGPGVPGPIVGRA